MKCKIWVFGLLFALVCVYSMSEFVYAAEENNEIIEENEVIDSDPAETNEDYSEIIKAIEENHADTTNDILYELRYTNAFLMILVVFETLRIVRSWSKGVGVK